MNKKDTLFYQIALTLVPQIGCVQARILIEKYGDAKTVFHTGKAALEKTEGIGAIRAGSIRSFSDFSRVEAEMEFIEKHGIRPLFITDPGYPQRLLNCYDPPPLLFYKGEADLNASHIIAVVGTRNPTGYGKQVTEKLLRDLAGMDVLVVSGLAYGIDGLAHKAALKHDLRTVGVLGHGLDSIYPAQHKSLAGDIIKQEGGLLTEFFSTTRPDKHNFPARNRIVAGICDAVIVVETPLKGGSMITAELANSYNRDVFAFPGKTTDTKSAGCNYLVRANKASLLTDARDLISAMGWEKVHAQPKPQKELFTELNESEQKLAALLCEKVTVHIDELNMYSGLSGSAIAAAMLNLELQGVIRCLPGKRYQLA
ncbi:MAG TPA: DNA-processing protein DprA [Chitinophagaceae bacterium]|nr:DNA-processing protein DprA [Chitinophagaceae bacterium]